jgi:hypothetical protein
VPRSQVPLSPIHNRSCTNCVPLLVARQPTQRNQPAAAEPTKRKTRHDTARRPWNAWSGMARDQHDTTRWSPLTVSEAAYCPWKDPSIRCACHCGGREPNVAFRPPAARLDDGDDFCVLLSNILGVGRRPHRAIWDTTLKLQARHSTNSTENKTPPAMAKQNHGTTARNT